MKKMLKRRIAVILLCIAVILGFLIYSNMRNKKLLGMIDSTKESLYTVVRLKSTGTDFKEIYNIDNRNLLYSKIKDHESKLLASQLELAYEGIEIDNLSLQEYITITGANINNKPYTEYEVNTRFFEEFVRNPDIKDITINFTINRENLIEKVTNLIETKVNIPMRGANGRINSGKMTITDSGQEGRTYDKEKLSEEIDRITTLTYKQLTDPNNLRVLVSTTNIPIYPTVEDLMNITTKVSSFSTGYSSSGGSRKQNIAVAAKNLNGTILNPGEILSVDKGIKGRNAANGYAKAGSYLNGKTVQTYGGGVCQVSTTLYGAILRAGIVPIERNAHSMSVSYVPLGLDAAISEGYKDLKIQNNYNTPIYIEANANGSTLTFNIYGNEGLTDGYTYQPASSSSNNGLKANSWLNKIKDGKVVEKINLFSSSYRPHS